MFLWSAQDRTYWLGDSIAVGFGGCYTFQQGLGRALTATVAAPTIPFPSSPVLPPSRAKFPHLNVDGQSGRAATDVGATMATQLAAWNACTAAVIALGINDADKIRQSLETVNQFSVAQLQIVDALNTIWGIPYSKMLWIGPWAHDSGDDAAAIVSVNAQCVTNAALRGFTFVQISQVPNTPVSVMTIGDGTHPLQPASDAIASVVMTAISYAA